MRVLAAVIMTVATLTAQIHAGIKVGMPLTDITKTQNLGGRTINRNVSHRWSIGPVVDVDLPANLGVEMNALYRKVGFEFSTNRNPISVSEAPFIEASGTVWDFPVIVKYRFPGDIARPYVGGGWTYRRLGDLLRFGSSNNGAVAAGGVRLHTPLVKISPDFDTLTGGARTMSRYSERAPIRLNSSSA